MPTESSTTSSKLSPAAAAAAETVSLTSETLAESSGEVNVDDEVDWSVNSASSASDSSAAPGVAAADGGDGSAKANADNVTPVTTGTTATRRVGVDVASNSNDVVASTSSSLPRDVGLTTSSTDKTLLSALVYTGIRLEEKYL